MNKEFIQYELALKLVELGFKERCLAIYTDDIVNFGNLYIGEYDNEYKNILAPLWQQAFRFFREKYSLSGEIYLFEGYWHFDINKKSMEIFTTPKHGDIETYEEAQQSCLEKLIEIVKQN